MSVKPLIISGKRELCDQKIVDLLVKQAHNLLKKKDHLVLGIPGGSSVSGIFSLLKESNLPWERIHLFMVDERVVPLTSEESNFFLAKKTFLTDLVENSQLPQQNIHPYTKKNGVKSYQQQLQQLGGKFDLLILSAGGDGHIASLFPFHQALQTPASTLFTLISDSPKPPPQRMTASPSLITASNLTFLLFYGVQKRSAYKNFLNPSTSTQECPAKLILQTKKPVIATSL